MTAGERIFVDFLPDSWTGPPPSLPAEVIRELSERARLAERALRAQLAVAAAKKKPPVRVRASVQPTFVRFVFEMPDGVNVSSVLNDQKLTLQFNNVLNFDLADAKVAAPPNVASITQRADTDSSAVDILLIGEVDVHSFREEKNYIVDVAFQQAEKAAAIADAHAPPAAAAHAPARETWSGAAQAGGAASPRSAGQSDAAGRARAAGAGDVGGDCRTGQYRNQARPAHDRGAPPARSTQHLPPRRSRPRLRKMAQAPEPAKEAVKVAKEDRQACGACRDDACRRGAEARGSEAGQGAVKAAGEPKLPSLKLASLKPTRPKRRRRWRLEPAAQAGPKAATVEARRDSDGLRVTFTFTTPTPAAMFRRADTVWLVFDKTGSIDLDPIRAKAGAIIGDVSPLPLDKGQAIRIRLNRPQMPSLESDPRGGGIEWTLTFADRVAGAAAAADGVAQHHRSRARQCQRAAGEPRPAVQADRSRCRRYAAGGHRAAAGPRLHQAAGFRRTVAAGIRSRRGGASEFRRRLRRGRLRQGDAGPAGRADAVVGRRRRRTRHRGGAAAVRCRSSGARTRTKTFCRGSMR